MITDQEVTEKFNTVCALGIRPPGGVENQTPEWQEKFKAFSDARAEFERINGWDWWSGAPL